MRIRSLLFIAACMVATVANAQKATSPTIGCAPLNVTFEAPAGATTSFWTFGDGATSTLANPVNPYTVAGTYTVVYRATAGGPPIGNPITVTVSPKPVPAITTASALKGCVPLSVTLNGGATLPANVTLSGVKWSYGDGSPAGTFTPTTHTYVTPGKFTVTLEIQTSSASCNVTKQFVDYISCSIPPATSFTTNPSPATACAPPLTVTFTNTTTTSLPPLAYEWTMHNGTKFNGTTPAPVTITTAGNYMVTLVAKDSNNCSSSFKVPISIGKPTASFTVNDTVCMNTPVTFTNTSSSGSYSWNFGTGATPLTSTATNPVVTYTTPGLKTVTLDVAAGSCSGTTTKTIYVDDPKITFTYTPVYSCYEPVKVTFNSTSSSPISTWNWSFGDKKNGTSTVEDPTYTYVVGDSIYTKRGMSVYTVTLNAVTKAGCKVSATHNDTIFLTWAKFVPNLYQGCAPLSVTFSDSSKSNTPREPITTWIWNYGDTTKLDTVNNKGPQVHVYTKPGIYNAQLTIINKNGCRDTSYTVRIEVGVVKPIDFTVDKTSICPGDSISFTNTTVDKTGFTGWHYSTSGELLSHCSTDDHPKLVFNDKTGPMDVTLTADYNGCMSDTTKKALITVKGPIAKFDFHRDCAKKFEVELTNKSGDATDLKWDFGDSTKLDTTGTMVKLTHVYKKTGDYKVVLIAINKTSGCVDSKDSAVIHIRNIQANFTSSKLLCQGTDYQFDAISSVDVNPYCYRGYTWEFSDPDKRPISTSNPAIPIAFYKNGLQTVSLIVEDINGCKDTATTVIKAYKLKASYVASDLSICMPTTVTFDPTASTADTTIASWKWFFGDGKTATIKAPGPGNTSNIYTNVTTPTVTATLVLIDTLGCTDTTRQVITIYKPMSKITVSPKTDICLGTELTFNADSQGLNLKFDWKMGDAVGVFSNTNNFKYTYTKSGTFTVELTYTEVGSGCTDKTTQLINVQDYPKANFGSNPSNTTVLCYPQVVDFFDSTATTSPIISYKWDLGNNLTSSSPNPSDSYQKGVYTVKLVVSTSFGCKDSTSKIYNVVGPTGDFTLVPNTPICRGELITFTVKDLVDVASYTWKFGDGSSATDVSPAVHAYTYVPPSGKIAGALILYDKNKVCSVSLPVDVFIKDVKANFSIKDINNVLDSTICDGQEVTLTFTGKGDKAIWNLGDNTTSTDSIVHHKYNIPGDYYVSLITSNASVGCSDTIVKLVSILPLPDITAYGDTICPNDPSATLHVRPNNGTITYQWTGVSNPTSTDPVVLAPTKSQSYYVAGTDVNGCTSVDSAFLYIVPPITPISFEKTIIVGDTVVLPVNNKNGTIKFTWTPTEGLSCLQCSNPWVQPIRDITYNLIMSDFKGCSTAPGKFIIHVKPETRIRVPTTFTPNGDGNNDIIYVKGWGIKDLVSFQIYNRWGELVFETSELSEGWNGFYKDVLQNNDIYTYKVKAVDFYGESMEAEGHINLMR